MHNCWVKNVNPLNWDDLRYFVAVVDAGSVSRAARTLAVEHTTVARRIDALEASLEVRLFDRFPKTWSLTGDGNALVAQARLVEQEVLAFARSACGASGLEGKVCVSGPPLLLSNLVAPQMRDALLRLPGIELEFVGEARDANLVRRDADIALRLQRPSAPSVTAKLLATIGFGLYGTQQYLDSTSAADWAFIAYNDSLAHTPQQLWVEAVAAGRRMALRANDMATLLHAARAGIGVAALPHYLGRSAPELVCALPADANTRRKLWLVMHEDVRRSPRVRAVADELTALFGRLVDADGLL